MSFSTVRTEFLDAFYSTFEPLLLVVLAVFVWHLWLAPSALSYEAARKAMNEKSSPPVGSQGRESETGKDSES